MNMADNDNGNDNARLLRILKAILRDWGDSPVPESLFAEAARRDPGLLRKDEDTPGFFERCFRALLVAGLLNGTTRGASVRPGTSKRLREELGLSQGFSLEPGPGKVDVYEMAALSILAARPNVGLGRRPPPAAPLAVEDALDGLERLVDSALSRPAAEEAAELLTNGGRRGNGDAVGPLSAGQADEYRRLARRALEAARFGTRNTRGVRGRLRRQALALERTVKTRARPAEALLDEVRGLLAVVKG
jgi:hypothetical protein